MKTIYSLNEFYNEVGKIAKLKGIEAWQAETVINSNGITFKCWIHHYDYCGGDTMEECLQNMLRQVFPEDFRNPTIDVEIELQPQQTTES